jgi:hypothetical protein
MTPYANALRILVQHNVDLARARLALDTQEIKGQEISGHPYFDLSSIHKFIMKHGR